MAGIYSYSKQEKLKSRKALQQLFSSGRSLQYFPVKLFYMPAETNAQPVLQAGVGVSSRHFKKAVDRNRIKRLLRECYRLNRQSLLQALTAEQHPLQLFLLYVGKELPEFEPLQQKVKQALTKLEENLVRSS